MILFLLHLKKKKKKKVDFLIYNRSNSATIYLALALGFSSKLVNHLSPGVRFSSCAREEVKLKIAFACPVFGTVALSGHSLSEY